MKLTDVLDFTKDTMLDMVIPEADGKKALEQFEECRRQIAEKFNPGYKKYLDGLNLAKVVAEEESMEKLMEYSVQYVTPEMRRELAEFIDDYNPSFSPAAKTVLYEVITMAYNDAGHNYCQPIFQGRLQELAARKHKSRIITPY